MVAPTTFHGMRPWPVETEMVECRGTAIGTVDLHNEADLVAVTVEKTPAGFSVIYSFSGAGDQIATDVLFALRFTGVRDFRLWQTDPLAADDQAVFHAVDLIRGEDGEIVFGLHAAIFESTFTADGVTFEVDSRSAMNSKKDFHHSTVSVEEIDHDLMRSVVEHAERSYGDLNKPSCEFYSTALDQDWYRPLLRELACTCFLFGDDGVPWHNAAKLRLVRGGGWSVGCCVLFRGGWVS